MPNKHKWPMTREEVQSLGWTLNREKKCRGARCGRMIEFFRTKNEAVMPMSVLQDGRLQPHFIDCPDAASFTKEKSRDGNS
jgi:hypothetical protein